MNTSQTSKTIRHLSSVLCPLVLCLFAATTGFAYCGGTGEPNDPYQICNVNSLLQLANDANDYNKCFIMTADIDLDGYDFNKPVIANDAAFTGIFDGNGRKIRNLTFDVNYIPDVGEQFGLFGSVGGGGEIENLGLEDINVTSSSPSEGTVSGGGLIWINGGGSVINCYVTGTIRCIGGGWGVGMLIGTNGGPVSNCYSMGTLYVADLTSEASYMPTIVAIGGLIGQGGELSNCWSSASVTVGPSPVWGDPPNYWWISDVGGLVGSGGSLIDCYSTGPVTGIGKLMDYVGGLVGSNGGNMRWCFSTSPVTTTDVAISRYIGGLVGTGGDLRWCYSTGNVTCGNESINIGGLVGYIDIGSGNVVNECFSTGDVTCGNASERIGGFIGTNSNDLNNCYSTGDVNCGLYSHEIGGLVGKSGGYDFIKNCYSSGNVTAGFGSTDIGGSIGSDDLNDILSTYFLDTAGPDNNLGEPLNDSQMKHCANFAGWDFVYSICNNGPRYIWFIFEGVEYPQLAWYLGICTVPDVVGLNTYYANEEIIEHGFTIGDVSYEYSYTVPTGYIISQNPAPGQNECRSAVSYVVSKGPWPCEIPNVVGLTMADANYLIINSGFTIGDISYGYSDTVPAGYVVSQNPAAGPSEECDLAISYIVSSGPIPWNGRVPDYDDDGIVNFIDFAIFADAWLTENALVDLTGDNYVNIYDLKIFCDYWLEEE